MPGDSLTDSNTFTYLMHGDMEGVHVKEVMGSCTICQLFFKEFLINNKITEYATNVDFFWISS